MASSEHRDRFGLAVAVAVVAVLVLSGCGGSGHKAAAGLFDNQNQATISCLNHQKQQPGTLYTGGENADTAHILEMMQYFTSYGDKPYCDGKAATAIDATWGRLYLSLGGQPVKVQTVLGNP